ncbi:MAG: hypothetical protein ACYTGZ_13025 [Planctomycetota bacterium]|jgi:hypothetical protein
MVVRRIVILGLLGGCLGCQGMGPAPRVEASAFVKGKPRAEVEAMTGTPNRVEALDHGQTRATYHVLFVAPTPRTPRALALNALRPDGAGQPGLSLMIHKGGTRGMNEYDVATAASNMLADYLWKKVTGTPEPAAPERRAPREPVPPRSCRVEVTYDARGRVLWRRIVPLEDPPVTATRWEDVPAPIGDDARGS